MPFVSPAPSWCPTIYALQARLTIPRDPSSPAASPIGSGGDPGALALSALGWLLTDQDRAARLLALTGLTPEALRDGLGDAATLGAVLDFLCAHEPDLVSAAEAVGVDPRELAGARERLAP